MTKKQIHSSDHDCDEAMQKIIEGFIYGQLITFKNTEPESWQEISDIKFITMGQDIIISVRSLRTFITEGSAIKKINKTTERLITCKNFEFTSLAEEKRVYLVNKNDLSYALVFTMKGDPLNR